MPESIAGVAHIDVVAGPDTYPCPSRGVVATVELRGRSQEPFRCYVIRQYYSSELRRVQPFRRLLFAPVEFGKPFRGVPPGKLLAFHPGHEVLPDIVHRLHVVATFLHQRITAVTAETDKRNSTFDPQARGFENLAALLHRHTRADRIIY